MRTEKVDVLVIGAGLTGLAAAALLAKGGVRALVVAKHPGTAPQPRGSFTNQRTVEIYRELGIEDAVVAATSRGPLMGHNVVATSLTGDEIFRYQTYGTGDRTVDYASASPCEYLNSPQHIVEPILLKAARDYGADVRFSNEMVSFEQDSEKVAVQVRDRDTGEEYLIEAAYVIGADGARSRVAELLDIEFEGERSLVHNVNAWIEADLTDLVSYRPAGLYIIIQPGGNSWLGSGTIGSVRHWNEWVLARQYDPAQGEPDLSDEEVIKVFRQLVGDPNLEVRVKGVAKWEVNTLIAKDYRKGRVFIAGDAAHRHSPSGGLGSNTCVQDAYNLAWKIAFVLKGEAGEGLLDSYEAERLPVGDQVVRRALANLHARSAIPDVLGLRKGQAEEEGWQAIRSLFSDTDGAEERRAELVKIRDLQHFRSNAHGIMMGQRYTSGAVADDGTPFPEPKRNAELYYEPTTHPGAYLPHVWLEHKRRRLSTLDLSGHGRFSLIVGIAGAPWEEAARELAQAFDIELPVYRIGYRCEYDDPLGSWEKVREMDDRGALLVRPDRHVAWRSATASRSPKADLERALRQVLSRG